MKSESFIITHFNKTRSSQPLSMDLLINKTQLKYKSRVRLHMQNENNQNQYLIDGQTLINL